MLCVHAWLVVVAPRSHGNKLDVAHMTLPFDLVPFRPSRATTKALFSYTVLLTIPIVICSGTLSLRFVFNRKYSRAGTAKCNTSFQVRLLRCVESLAFLPQSETEYW